MSEPAPRERRAPRRNSWPRRIVIVALVLLVFALGIALGQALNDGPPSPSTVTYIRTLTPSP